MMNTTTFHTAMAIQDHVSVVLKTVKDIQKHVVKNVMHIYVPQQLRIALNIFIVNNYNFLTCQFNFFL